jgi:serine/threonine protein kinase
MLDLRNEKVINLSDADALKNGAAYKFIDLNTGKQLVAKLITDYDDRDDWRLIAEFKKMALLSAEAQIGTVYFLAKCKLGAEIKSCYVLEFIKGDTLEDHLLKHESLSLTSAYDLIYEIAVGMEKAHSYSIFHNDLHSRNVMLDYFGNIKIIDFLWYEGAESDEKKHARDQQGFREIITQIVEKCRAGDKQGLKCISQTCLETKSFRGVPKIISRLFEISEELRLLNQISMDILGSYLESLPEDYNISQLWVFDWEPVPEKILKEFPEEDIPSLENRMPGNGKPVGSSLSSNYFDTRLLKITSAVKTKFDSAFFEVEKLGLMHHHAFVKGSDHDEQWEPYFFNYAVTFTPKFLKWRSILKDHKDVFILSEKPMSEIIFSDKP